MKSTTSSKSVYCSRHSRSCTIYTNHLSGFFVDAGKWIFLITVSLSKLRNPSLVFSRHKIWRIEGNKSPEFVFDMGRQMESRIEIKQVFVMCLWWITRTWQRRDQLGDTASAYELCLWWIMNMWMLGLARCISCTHIIFPLYILSNTIKSFFYQIFYVFR